MLSIAQFPFKVYYTSFHLIEFAHWMYLTKSSPCSMMPPLYQPKVRSCGIFYFQTSGKSTDFGLRPWVEFDFKWFQFQGSTSNMRSHYNALRPNGSILFFWEMCDCDFDHGPRRIRVRCTMQWTHVTENELFCFCFKWIPSIVAKGFLCISTCSM